MSENVTEAPGVTGQPPSCPKRQAPVDSPRDPAGKVSAASQPLGLRACRKSEKDLPDVVDNDLTKFAGGGLASVGGVEGGSRPSLDAYSQGDGSQHVNFIDDNGHVHKLYNP